MKILQVIFKLKNANIKSMNSLVSSEHYTNTVVFDYSSNEELYENVEEYDYIVFNNPNFDTNYQAIEKHIKSLENKDNCIIQYSLLAPENSSRKYRVEDYRELFPTIIASTKELTEHNLIKLYFKLTVNDQRKKFISTKYIGRDLRNNWHKEDIINLTIILFENYEIQSFRDKFESDEQFIKFLDFIIDNKVFEKFLERDKQIELLKLFKQKLNEFYQIRQRKNTQLYLFYSLLDKEYYHEALLSLTLYRSRRYWYHVTQDIDSLMDPNVDDVRNTKAWIKTQKLRDTRINIVKRLKKVEKIILKIISKIYKLNSKKQIWILSERTNTASDNSYFLFEYLQKSRKDIISYYLIDKSAKNNLPKLKEYKNILFLGSYKHKLFMLIADKYLTSFTIEETMLPFNSEQYKEIYKTELENKTIISIQHGMIMNNISPYLSKKHYLVDYITANNLAEKEIIIQTLGYSENEVIITGMARQDNLLKNTCSSNNVLFMPTWQRGLQNLTIPQFLSTEYYKKINEMVKDSSLSNFLEKNNLSLKVLMHPQFEKFSQYFHSENENIEFASTNKFEIPEMIAKSKFLITDFSSIAADFLFQGKNVVFYQYNKYSLHHVPTKQIKYSDIGEVVGDLQELNKSLRKIEENEFKLLDKYKKSYQNLFDVKSNIRENIVNSIKKLK